MTHGLDQRQPTWDQASGAMQLVCLCGWKVRDFPAAPKTIPDAQLRALEAAQVAKFRRHLEEMR